MWVRGTAIRPVPSYARVSAGAVDVLRRELSEDEDDIRSRLDEAYERFEREQPELASYLGEALEDSLDETALALGYFLTLVVWMTFEQAHRGEVAAVTREALDAAAQSLDLDEQLRKRDPADSLDTDDVVGMEQPAVITLVHEHVDATLEAHGDETDVDHVHRVFRLVLVEVLALSYAVRPPVGFPVGKSEMLA
ncbi:MAG: hypothetical protein FJ104_02145 [Deltaproteobacteria bacterium]|nr:hypothetical protein [Deltaproteobacteria bacterium]